MFNSITESHGLGFVALSYVALDYWRDQHGGSLIGQWLQPCLWGALAISALAKSAEYRYWALELRAFPKFLAALAFMLAALAVEAISVHFVTAVMGLQWHRETAPLPDTGQWILLALNDVLPASVRALLRAPLIGLHHYIMLFVMLGFSTLFGYGKAPHVALAARYMFSMGLGRLLRVATFAGTILPSARPWCADSRFWGTAEHPHPWAQRFYSPYARDTHALKNLLHTDTCPALPTNGSNYPPEYVPNWGWLQFLATILRPPQPSSAGRRDWQGDTWITTLTRAGGGCNDLAYSGHILVSTLTAMAWHEVYPGWASVTVWLLLLHSAQREIRERHHYSLDVVMGIYAGIFIWRSSKFIWSRAVLEREERGLGEGLDAIEGALRKAAKEGDLEKVRSLLWQQSRGGRRGEALASEGSAHVQRMGMALAAGCIILGLIAFIVLRAG